MVASTLSSLWFRSDEGDSYLDVATSKAMSNPLLRLAQIDCDRQQSGKINAPVEPPQFHLGTTAIAISAGCHPPKRDHEWHSGIGEANQSPEQFACQWDLDSKIQAV